MASRHDVLPRDNQIAGLRLWPPPEDFKYHKHGVEVGGRCTSQILHYRHSAECPRCGRVWLRSREKPEIEHFRSRCASLPEAIAEQDELVSALDAARRTAVANWKAARKHRAKLEVQLATAQQKVRGADNV